MNRVTLCSNCREKSREIIAYGEKLAAAEARLVQYEAEAEERRLELNVVSAAIFAVKNRGESAAYDGLRDRVADLMTFRLTVRKEKGTR